MIASGFYDHRQIEAEKGTYLMSIWLDRYFFQPLPCHPRAAFGQRKSSKFSPESQYEDLGLGFRVVKIMTIKAAIAWKSGKQTLNPKSHDGSEIRLRVASQLLCKVCQTIRVLWCFKGVMERKIETAEYSL